MNRTFFTMWVNYAKPTFRVTKQVRAYDVDSLIGNVGGYIGMFLGYALLNLPEFLRIIFTCSKNHVMKNTNVESLSNTKT